KKRKIDAGEDTREGTAEPSHLDRKDDSKKDTEQDVAGEEKKSVGNSHQRRKCEAPQVSDSTIICPVSKIPEKRCNWVGTQDSLERHVTRAHFGILRRCPIFRCGSFQNNVLLILFKQEIFLYYKHVSITGRVYAVVQQVGVTNKEFKYTIELRAEYETVVNITFSFKTEKTSEPLETIFDARRCMDMNKETLIPFVVKDELNMTVKISETYTHGNRPTEVTEGDNTGKKKKMSAHHEDKADSEKVLTHAQMEGTVTCPLVNVSNHFCTWVGKLDNLKEHVEDEHGDVLSRGCVFECVSLTNNALLVLAYTEIFLYYKHISSYGVMYVIVQQVCVTREKYRYIVNFLGDDYTDEIILDFAVQEISKPLDKVLKSGECLAITEERLRPFIRGDKMAMAVKIEKVLTHAQMEGIDMNSAVTCPLLKVSDHFCSWLGKLSNLEEHVEGEHGDVLSRGCTFGCQSLTNKALLVLAYNEMFLYYKQPSQSGGMFVIVQQVGLTNRKYGYAVKLSTRTEEFDITCEFNAYKITEPFGPIFDNRRCMVLHADLGPQIESGNLAMSVAIREHSSSEEETDEWDSDESASDEEYFDEEEDKHVNTTCPLEKIPEKSCPWVGPFHCLYKHVDNIHEDVLKKCFSFPCNSLQDKAFLILFQGEIFLYYKHFSQAGIMYAVVQQVGLTKKKYKYSIEISSLDRKVRSITFTSVTDWISEPFKDVFNAQGCLVVSSERLVPYVLYDKISMFVSISGLSP
ncbi:hypothetical protein B7P43_G04203, partial [Cryptotermes secundus]